MNWINFDDVNIWNRGFLFYFYFKFSAELWNASLWVYIEWVTKCPFKQPLSYNLSLLKGNRIVEGEGK